MVSRNSWDGQTSRGSTATAAPRDSRSFPPARKHPAADGRHAEAIPVVRDARHDAREARAVPLVLRRVAVDWPEAQRVQHHDFALRATVRGRRDARRSRASIVKISRMIPPTPVATPVAAPWNGSMAIGWLCDSILNATAQPFAHDLPGLVAVTLPAPPLVIRLIAQKLDDTLLHIGNLLHVLIQFRGQFDGDAHAVDRTAQSRAGQTRDSTPRDEANPLCSINSALAWLQARTQFL